MALLLLGKPFCPLPFLSDCWVTISVDNGLWIRNGMAHMGLSHAHDDDDDGDDDDDDTHTRVLSSHAGPSFVFSSSALPAPAREIAPRIRELRRRRRLLGSTTNQPARHGLGDHSLSLPGCGPDVDSDQPTVAWNRPSPNESLSLCATHTPTLCRPPCVVVRRVCECVLTTGRAHERPPSRTTKMATSFTNLATSWRIDVREYQI